MERPGVVVPLEGVVPLMHMPLHTPGLDCGAVRLFGQWITSIPATGSSVAPGSTASMRHTMGTPTMRPATNP